MPPLELARAIPPQRLPAFLVWLAAAVLTAHGMFTVAAGCGLPWPLATLYPIAVDGLALVAYRTAADVAIHTGGRLYAGAVVLLCAGSSGTAQAVYLVRGSGQPWQLAAGVGAAPAVLAVLAAHLDWLASRRAGSKQASGWSPGAAEAGRGEATKGAAAHPARPDDTDRTIDRTTDDRGRNRLHLVGNDDSTPGAVEPRASAVEDQNDSTRDDTDDSSSDRAVDRTPDYTDDIEVRSAAAAAGRDDSKLVALLREAREQRAEPLNTLRPVAALLGTGERRARRIIRMAGGEAT